MRNECSSGVVWFVADVFLDGREGVRISWKISYLKFGYNGQAIV
jgi:hypothetical protein